MATGAAFIGLGSDTGGSIRIPAALCGIVGFKNTARLTPLEGALPLSTTLDTVCAMTRSVRDAILAHEILAARQVARSHAAAGRLPPRGGAHQHARRSGRHRGARLRAQRAGACAMPVPASRRSRWRRSATWAACRPPAASPPPRATPGTARLLERKGDGYDPRVRFRIERGAAMKAYEYIDLIRARRDWIARVAVGAARLRCRAVAHRPHRRAADRRRSRRRRGWTRAQDAARDEEFFRVNALLLRNTSVVNMLDGCAISIPCHRAGELPVGLMIWHGAMHDDTVLNIALQAQDVLAATHGNS